MAVIALGVGLAALAMRHRVPAASSAREYATVAGKRLSVTLVDGTRVTLAPASRVRVAADYGRDAASREVELEGEAYFAVIHDAAHPFAVRARGATARDVGTAFDLRAYPEDAEARIAVADGAVAVTMADGCRVDAGAEIEGRATSPVALPQPGAPENASAATRPDGPCAAEAHAGDVVAMSRDGIAVTHNMDVRALTAWTGGRFVFRAAMLGEVAEDLGRWYGLDVRVDPSVAARHLVGSLSATSVEEALHIVAGVADVQVERDGRRVRVLPRDGAGQ